MAHAPDNAFGQQAGQCAVFRRGCLAEDARQFWRVDERHLAEEVEHLPVGECHGGSLPECMGDRQPARKARGDDAPRCRCDLKYGVGLNHMPSARFAANGAWLARIGLGERTVITKTLRRRVFALVGRITRSARRLTLHLPRRWPWETQFSRALARLQAIPFPA